MYNSSKESELTHSFSALLNINNKAMAFSLKALGEISALKVTDLS